MCRGDSGICWLVFLLGLILVQAAVRPKGQLLSASPCTIQENYTFLENGYIKLGVNLARGGSIGWVSTSTGMENLVNEHDMGREIQLSFYAAPAGFDTPDKNVRLLDKVPPYLVFLGGFNA